MLHRMPCICTSLVLCNFSHKCLLLIHPTTPTFHLSFVHFFTMLSTHLGLPHPTIAHFHVVNVDIPLMIWVLICFNAHAGVSALQCTILFGIPLQLLFWKVKHMYRERFPTFFPTMLTDESSILVIINNFQTLTNVVIAYIRFAHIWYNMHCPRKCT